jgi:ferredoxin--NADP+ reductase
MHTTEEIKALREQHYNATLTEILELNPELWIIRVKPDEELPPYKPGQYTTLGLGDWEPTNDPANNEDANENLKTKLVRRAYSMSFPMFENEPRQLMVPENMDYYEFYITLVARDGEPGQDPSLTPRLWLLKEGDRLWMGPKVTGHYTLDYMGPDDQVIFAATGTGEAPHNCMIADLLRNGHKPDILSVVCVRYARDLGYQSTNEQLERLHQNYHYITLTTREAHNLDRKVYIQDLVQTGEMEERTGITLDPERTHVYICGNPDMIGVPNYTREGDKSYPSPTGIVELLESRGFKADHRRDKGNIHFEEYW